MPGQDGVETDDRRNLAQDLPPEQPALGGRTPALMVRQAEPSSPELLPQNAVLFLEVVNDVLLVQIDPAGKRCQKYVPGPQIVENPAILRRMTICTLRARTIGTCLHCR